MKPILCYFDGSCDPNPGGVMGWGWIVRDTSQNSGHVPKSPNNSCNVAEYMAVYFLLEEVDRLLKIDAISKNLTIHGDSKLVINQMSGYWKIKKGKYKTWAEKSKRLLDVIEKEHDVNIEFKWVRRDNNAEADVLSKAHANTDLDTSHFSSDWIKIVVKSMVESKQITLEELCDYVTDYS